MARFKTSENPKAPRTRSSSSFPGRHSRRDRAAAEVLCQLPVIPQATADEFPIHRVKLCRPPSLPAPSSGGFHPYERSTKSSPTGPIVVLDDTPTGETPASEEQFLCNLVYKVECRNVSNPSFQGHFICGTLEALKVAVFDFNRDLATTAEPIREAPYVYTGELNGQPIEFRITKSVQILID